MNLSFSAGKHNRRKTRFVHSRRVKCAKIAEKTIIMNGFPLAFALIL